MLCSAYLICRVSAPNNVPKKSGVKQIDVKNIGADDEKFRYRKWQIPCTEQHNKQYHGRKHKKRR